MSELFAGPWIGEFGWEIMGWQGYVRRTHNEMQSARTVVACRPSSQALYEDFADDIIPVEVGWDADFHRNADHPHVDWPEPMEGAAVYLRTRCAHPDNQDFVPYGKKSGWLDERPYVVVHAREMTKFGTSFRNWSAGKWDRFTKAMLDEGVDVLAVGQKGSSYRPEGSFDALDRPLVDVMDVMRAANVVVGPTSGPIHLAALCEPEKMVVWTDAKHVGKWGLTNKERLERSWNPFQVDVDVLDGWDPDWEKVVEHTLMVI